MLARSERPRRRYPAPQRVTNQKVQPAALRSLHVGHTGYLVGSHVGTHFLPQSASIASPVTYARAASRRAAVVREAGVVAAVGVDGCGA